MERVQRFYVLDAFRGIAAILVCMYHMPKVSVLTNNAFITKAGIFVDLFFVLSGFVIYHNYKDRLHTFKSSKMFMVKRFKRLLPLHLYTLAVLLLLEVIKALLYPNIQFANVPFEVNTMQSFWSQVFLVNSTPLFMGFNWNFPNWSISAEIIAYIIFAMVAVGWAKRNAGVTVTAGLIIILGYFFYKIQYGVFNPLVDFKVSFIRGTIGFFVGVIIYVIRQRLLPFLLKISKMAYNSLEIGILAVTVYLVIHLYEFQTYFFIYHAAFAALILVCSMECGMLSKLLKYNPFQKLGLWSYSIYLNHVLMIILFNKFIVKHIPENGIIIMLLEVISLIALCLYSSITYKWIERRFYNPRKIKENSEPPIHNSEAQNQG